MDTFTSFLAGVTIFSILGNLAHESGKPIEAVVQGGTGLAFVSYPEAISKFTSVPQLFAVLFFLMMFTLGVGTTASYTGSVITIICDAFPNWKRWKITLVTCLSSFILGLVYVTPGGQYVLDVVDFFGGGLIFFVLAIVEVIAIFWIYGKVCLFFKYNTTTAVYQITNPYFVGLNHFLRDVQFMLGIRLGIYWKFTWVLVIPMSLLAILIYSLITFRSFTSNGYVYPTALTSFGWVLAAFAIFQLPIWAFLTIYRKKGSLLCVSFFKDFIYLINEISFKTF